MVFYAAKVAFLSNHAYSIYISTFFSSMKKGGDGLSPALRIKQNNRTPTFCDEVLPQFFNAFLAFVPDTFFTSTV
jgi:hypothetical protein